MNGVRYPLIGPVQLSLISLYPEKLVIGDVSKDSQPTASVVAWNDWQGGIGLERMTERDPANRAWWSTCSLNFKNHLLLPPLATITAASGVAGSFTIGAIGELASEIYVAFGTAVRKYDRLADSWGATLTTLPAVATDALSFRLGGVDYLAFAHTDGYTYTSDGTTWVNDTTDTKLLVFWDQRLWGLSNTGQLWRSTAIGAETNDSTVPLPAGYFNSLFSARNAAGTIILYCATRVGLYAHDATNAKWEVTSFDLPNHPDNGLGGIKWRDASYNSAGLAIYSIVNGANTAVVELVGPDRDHGLPTAQQGTIVKLAGTHAYLLALVDGATEAAAVNMFDGFALGLHEPAVIVEDTGYSSLLGWTERGWEVRWLSASGTAAATAIYVSGAYDRYRVWWGHNRRIYWMDLPIGIVNPDQVTTYTFALSGEHITPWLVPDAKDVDAIALALLAELQRATSTETVVVDYAINYATTWTNLGTITTNGLTTYLFPSSATPTGTAFLAIRFRLTLARGSTNTTSPDVVSLTFVYRKKLKPRWGAEFTLDLRGEYLGKSPRQLQDALVTATESNVLVEFTFHTDTAAGNPRNYYVDVRIRGKETTGHEFTGLVDVSVMEP